MAFLINRAPAGRIQCLHSLCKLINSQFGTSEQFNLIDIKYEPLPNINIHAFCDLIKRNESLDINYCPYKQNVLDPSGCGITNGKNSDSTKSKEISNTVNSLHALGLITRYPNNKIKLTDDGKKFATTEYSSNAMLPIIRKAVLNYGPMIGLLAQIKISGNKSFDTSDIEVGYPLTKERVIFEKENLVISSGSEDDSNVRTRSCLLAWGLTAGFFKPESFKPYDSSKAHIEVSDYVLGKIRAVRKLEVLDFPNIFEEPFITKRPLDYVNLTKKSEALRENNQQSIRNATLHFGPILKNRRFAILYILNNCYRNGTVLSITGLVSFFKKYPEYFVINDSDLSRTLQIELKIAYCAGIPYIQNGDKLKPMVGMNLDELTINAPLELIKLIENEMN